MCTCDCGMSGRRQRWPAMDHGSEPFCVVCRGREDTRRPAEYLRGWIACVLELMFRVDVITIGYVFVYFLGISWSEISLCHVERLPDSAAKELFQWLTGLFLD
ncbi:hypothetical protein BDV27DRAFT_121296 [Aspergillus caelatus]|uniref:Uncharacterized protein n=1 Tax=Aspergillus caelatus TaxID=61420 RepID=A0A5N7AH99_9EURO|nr:uncharacterized protein BDV27DRAFT_121296 [Aspergillus caelatus]KAE8369251.1 hypothetical protein BDV27DRAFT_121296 [Aspergillus caelatus]